MENRDFATQLRAIAKLYEENPSLPQFSNNFTVYGQNKESLAKIAMIIGTCKKDYSDSFFKLQKEFGEISLSFLGWREDICKRKVVGKRLVVKDVEQERVYKTEEVEEDIIEWECPDSLLDTKITK